MLYFCTSITVRTDQMWAPLGLHQFLTCHLVCCSGSDPNCTLPGITTAAGWASCVQCRSQRGEHCVEKLPLTTGFAASSRTYWKVCVSFFPGKEKKVILLTDCGRLICLSIISTCVIGRLRAAREMRSVAPVDCVLPQKGASQREG